MELRQFLLLSTAWVIALADDTKEHGGPDILSTLVTPRHYTIDLTIPPNFHQTKRFTGTVEIILKVHESTNYIVLHSSGIKYPKRSVMILDSMLRKAIPVTLVDRQPGTVLLTTPEYLEPNEYILRFVDYEGIIHEDMYGLYLSSYTNEKNETEYLVATQFQPIYASRVFPCFDQPKFKAVFYLSVTRPADYMTLSNTVRTVVDEGNIDRFRETPTMSTYTLAFVVSKLKGFLSSQHPDKLMPLDVWCREEKLPTARYAYEMAQELLTTFTDFTGINYYRDMIKLDLVALPDLGPGAMENWGLITFKEHRLLWEKGESTEYWKRNILMLIAHEIAHMWFGNLVTLKWWSYTWLNEAFAAYYQYRVTAELMPDWEIEKQFVVDKQLPAMKADTHDDAPELNMDVLYSSEIKGKFSPTTYRKGACVLKMLVNIMGENKFKKGIHKYLDENSYKNVEPPQLYDSLSDFLEPIPLPATLHEIMYTWTDFPGFPVVMVRRNSSGFILTQKKFSEGSRRSSYKWFVPITYTTEESPDFTNTNVAAWLVVSKPDLFIPNKESKGWIVVNLLATGFYRVNYEERLWQALAKALNAENFTDVFPDVNRALIVDDAMNLARIDAISYKTALTVVSFLEKDISYYPWATAFNMFNDMIIRFSSSSYVAKTLRKHLLKLMTNLRKSVNFDDRNRKNQVSILKAMVTLEWACKWEEKSCLEESDAYFNDYMNGKRIDPTIRSTVYCSAVRQDQTGEKWRFLWGKYQETKLTSDKEIILSALGCSKNETVLKEYLHLSLNTSSGISKHDFDIVLKAVLDGNPSNLRVAFEFLKQKIEVIAIYIKGISSLRGIVTSFAERFRTKEEIDEYDEFLVQNSRLIGLADGGIDLLMAAKRNLHWIRANTKEIEDWLRDKYDSASGMVTVTSVLIWGSLVAVVGLSF